MPPTIRSAPPEGFTREQGPGGLEVRTIPGKERLEARATAAGKKMLVGYGSVSNVTTTIEGWFSEWDEEVADGAWTKTIAEGDIRSMFNHDTNWLLGRTKSGSLRLEEDDVGLEYETDINGDDPNALSVYAKVERGDVDGSSVWFRVLAEEWTYPTKDNGLERAKRRITEAQLFETGPVVFPAFEQTTVTARSAWPKIDQALRIAGVDEASRRARRACELIADPVAIEAELRSLFASSPELRDAVCSCSTEHNQPQRAAGQAPVDGNGTPPSGHLPAEYFHRRARATASRSGLVLSGQGGLTNA